MATFISRSPDETRALGEQWGRDARPGWVIALTGDLGAGKTELVKGIARGLGAGERVHSPTFAIVNVYHGGRLPLFHLDLFRLETPEHVARAGLEEYLQQTTGLTVVEWGERWFGDRANARLKLTGSRLKRVEFEVLSERERRLEYEDSGD